MSILNSLFLCAFLLSAAVQYNDPDALAWIVLYLGGAALCIAYRRGRLRRWQPLLLLSICLLWISTLLPGILGQVSLAEIVASVRMQSHSVEEAREIGGLGLVAVWSAVLLHRQGRAA